MRKLEEIQFNEMNSKRKSLANAKSRDDLFDKLYTDGMKKIQEK